MKKKTNQLVPTILVKNESYWLPYVLESLRGHFSRYVIYDVGSTDETQEIIDNFVQSERKDAEFFVRLMPDCPPVVQGAFRNSMMAEARSEWTFMVDGDEIYTEHSLNTIVDFSYELQYYEQEEVLYGMVPRIEVQADLKTAYGVKDKVPHHRLYHRTAIFGGPHPNEYQVYEGRGKNQMWLPAGAVCWHFHGTLRSPMDAKTHGRLDRKKKPTYLRGKETEINLLDELPILKTPIGSYPVNPVLEDWQKNGIP